MVRMDDSKVHGNRFQPQITCRGKTMIARVDFEQITLTVQGTLNLALVSAAAQHSLTLVTITLHRPIKILSGLNMMQRVSCIAAASIATLLADGSHNQSVLKRVLKADITIRVNPDVDARTHAKITTGKSDNKFGIPLKFAAAAYEAASKYPNIQLRGVQKLIALADYATASLRVLQGPTLIAYPDDPAQTLAAQNLGQYLQDHGWQKVHLQAYDPTADALPLGSRSVFYLGNGGGFSRLATRLQSAGQVPYLFAASSQVAGDLLQVPDGFTRRVFLAYPFVPSDWTQTGRMALTLLREGQGLGAQHAVLQVGAYTSMLLLSEGMKQAGRDASREKLVTALEGLHDFDTGLTPRLSFGPGRRLGLSGAHVVTVDLPDQRFYLVAPYKPIVASP